MIDCKNQLIGKYFKNILKIFSKFLTLVTLNSLVT